MTLRTKVVLYILLIHLLFAAVAVRVLWEDRTWLFIIEGIFLLSLVLSFKLVQALFVPLELIGTGAELMAERDFISRFHPVGQPEMDRLIQVYNQMIDQLREERLKVREQNELLDRIMEASPAGILIADLDGDVIDLNPSAAALFDKPREQLLGRSPGAIEGPLGTRLAELDAGESRVVGLAGSRRIRVRRASFLDQGFQRDFYLLEELTEELRQTEKAAYGKLIRLMSHEVNNSVGAVSSLLGSISRSADMLPEEERRDFAKAIEIATGRLESLRGFVDRFADVVRLPPPALRSGDVERLLEDVLDLFEPSWETREIRCVRELAGDLPAIDVDLHQFERVLVNVLKNSSESIEHNGTITVRTGAVGNGGWLSIEDDGQGIPAAIHQELFTPFFTTKKDGCGLGLTLVREVLDGHGFPFALESTDRGARFRVELTHR